MAPRTANANDNIPSDAQAAQPGTASGPAVADAGRGSAPYTGNIPYTGAGNPPPTYTAAKPRLGATAIPTYTRVTDDFGEHVEIRVGETVILGALFDAVLADMKSKLANEG